MLVKNIIKSVEVGAYGNYTNLIPLEILQIKLIPNSENIKICINYAFANSDKTIVLWSEHKINSINWASFGLEKPEPIKVLHSYEAIKYDNTIAFRGQAYSINDFYKKFNIGFMASLRIRCID